MPRVETLEGKKHQIAIKYRYEGKKDKEISKIIKNITGQTMSEYTIRNWFVAGGKLHDSYCDYMEKQNESLIKKGRQELKGLVTSAIKVVKNAMVEYMTVKVKCPNCKEEFLESVKIPTTTKLSASKEVLDRVLGKADENININAQVGLYSKLKDDELERRTKDIERELKTIEGRKIEEDGSGTGD